MHEFHQSGLDRTGYAAYATSPKLQESARERKIKTQTLPIQLYGPIMLKMGTILIALNNYFPFVEEREKRERGKGQVLEPKMLCLVALGKIPPKATSFFLSLSIYSHICMYLNSGYYKNRLNQTKRDLV